MNIVLLQQILILLVVSMMHKINSVSKVGYTKRLQKHFLLLQLFKGKQLC